MRASGARGLLDSHGPRGNLVAPKISLETPKDQAAMCVWDHGEPRALASLLVRSFAHPAS